MAIVTGSATTGERGVPVVMTRAGTTVATIAVKIVVMTSGRSGRAFPSRDPIPNDMTST